MPAILPRCRHLATVRAACLVQALLPAGTTRLDRAARSALAALALLLPALAAQALSIEPPTPAPQRPVTDQYFGVTLTDPYRWLENVSDAEVQQWMRAQADYSRAVLDAIPGRTALLARLTELENATPARVADLQRRPGGRLFFQRRGARDQQFKLYVRDRGGERLLVDPEAIGRKLKRPHAINYYTPSASGRYLAYGLSAAGSEDAALYVIDTVTRKQLAGPIERAEYGGVAWLPDDSGLFFNRLQPLPPGAPAVEKYQKSRAVFLMLGADVERAPVALRFDSPGAAFDPAQDAPFVAPVPGSALAAGQVFHGTDRELSLYVAPLAAAASGSARWRKVIDRGDAVVAVEIVGSRLYALTHAGTPRFRLVETSLAQPDLASARTLMEGGSGVLTGLVRTADALYVSRRDGSASSLFRLPLDAAGRAGAPQPLPLPLAGSFEFGGADWRLPGLLLTLQGWTRAPQIYAADARGLRNTGLQPRGRFDSLAGYVATEVTVPSHDGAPVPLSLIHKRGLKLDGGAPTILWGYGAYGITDEPWFSSWRLAWLERGGVFAVANPRGSGAYGQDWYKAGFQATKPNTWRDLIACAEWLIGQRYTAPARLGIWGGSAGGIAVGRAMTERPELFAAVVPEVGVLDAVRSELEPNGVSNIPEFGTHATAAGFNALLAMSTYHHVVDGTRYPAVLLTHGVNDPRVAVWHSLKTAARLQAASASGKPVLLRLDYDAGHGIGSSKAQRLAERADVLAFLRWQFGVAGPARGPAQGGPGR